MERSDAVAAVFMPVPPPTTFEETVERLGTAIRLGLLAPGSQLPPERELAEQLRISRSTLRQALTTLVQSGHLVSLRGRKGGTFVAEQPPLADAERRAARPGRLGGARLPGRDRGGRGRCSPPSGRGRRELDRLERAGREDGGEVEDFEEYRRTDMRFHIGLAEAAGLAAAGRAMTDVQGQMSDLIALIAHPAEVLARSNEQHARLVKALRKRRRRPRRCGSMREHIEGTEHILAGLLPARGSSQTRIRSPSGSKSGSRATSPSTQRPKISTSTAVPGSRAVGRQVGVGDRALDRVAVAAGRHPADASRRSTRTGSLPSATERGSSSTRQRRRVRGPASLRLRPAPRGR